MNYLTFLLIFFTFKSFALLPCGKGSLEQSKDFIWQKALTIQVNSSFQDNTAIICVAQDVKNPLLINQIVYRDIHGRTFSSNLTEMKNGVYIVKEKDLPSEAKYVLRSGHYVSLRVGEIKYKPKESIYTFSVRFLRNMSRGFSDNDYREISFKGHISATDNSVYSEVNDDTFDELELNLSTLPIFFTDIFYYQKRVLILKQHSSKLPKKPTLI